MEHRGCSRCGKVTHAQFRVEGLCGTCCNEVDRQIQQVHEFWVDQAGKRHRGKNPFTAPPLNLADIQEDDYPSEEELNEAFPLSEVLGNDN